MDPQTAHHCSLFPPPNPVPGQVPDPLDALDALEDPDFSSDEDDAGEERNKSGHKETRLIPRRKPDGEPLLLHVKKNHLRCSWATTSAQHHREPHPLLLTTAHQ
uniref:Uncharacterized protein n=1 Tax=Knipowitschia caucasica TaxID=637954 RepID=A0AAV2KTF8_KNICA